MNDLAARAALIATPADRPRAVAVESAPKVMVKPIRITTDLAPQSYRALADFAVEAAGELGVARVNHSEVMRVFVEWLAADPAIRAETISALRDARAS